MPTQPLLVGRTVLLVIDIQNGAFADDHENGIPEMPDYRERMHRACTLIDAARKYLLPIVFLQESHRPDFIDFGRELDGAEGVHLLENDPATEVAAKETGFTSEDYLVRKRRYSGFFGTELEILLKGLKAETLLLVGGMTDVCVHYTFVDAHQHDYYCRVAEDAVGGTSLEAHQASLAAMEYLQSGAVISVDTLLAAMARQNEKAA